MAAGTYAFVYAYFDKEFVPIKVVTTFFFIDFLIRVFGNLSYSPSGFVGGLLVRGRAPDWVSPEPKRFAWSLGLVMSFSMMLITNSNIHRRAAPDDLPDLHQPHVARVGARLLRRLLRLRPRRPPGMGAEEGGHGVRRRRLRCAAPAPAPVEAVQPLEVARSS